MWSPSCRSDPVYRKRSRRSSGRPWMTPPTRPMPNSGCANWSPNWERPYPSAAACLAEDLSALCIHLNYFPRLRKRFRSSNLLERSLEEVRRRTKVIGRFPGETSCLSMCWAVLDLFLAEARGLGLSDLEYKQVGPMKIARSHSQQALSKVA